MYKVGTICKIVEGGWSGSTLDGILVRIIDIKPNLVYDYTAEIINKDLLKDPNIQFYFHDYYRWFSDDTLKPISRSLKLKRLLYG